MIMRLKNKYKSPFKLDGVYYDFSNYNEEKLTMVFNNHPKFRFIFEEEDKELEDLGINNNDEFKAIIEEVVKKPKRRKR